MKAWRLEFEALFYYLSKADETEYNNSYTRADMRSMLDQLRDRQPMPVWSLSKDEAYPPAPYVEDEEEDQVISRPDRANDGGYDEHTMDIDHVASEALEKGSVEKAAEKAEAEKAAAEKAAADGKTMEETQLEAADETHQDEEITGLGASEGTTADVPKDSFVTKTTTGTKKTTLTRKSGVTKKTVVRKKTVVTRKMA